MAKLKLWKSFSVLMVLALMLALIGAVVVPTRVDATGPTTVLINEFVSNPSSGNEWVELFNITNSAIDLTNYKIFNDVAGTMKPIVGGCSATIPANGILVVEFASGWLPDSPSSCNITLLDSLLNGIHSVNYGTGLGTDVAPPDVGKSAARFDAPTNWQTNQTPTKGWFNDCGIGPAPCLTTIDNQLAQQGITSNIGELPNPSATPTGDAGLYFEKTGMGKIILTTCLNLSNQNTVTALQALGQKMEIAAALLKFDSATATAMSALGAKLVMYGLSFPGMPDLTVLTDAGAVIPPGSANYPTITNPTYVGGTFTFSSDHFTQFKAVQHVEATPSGVGADDSSYGERSSTTLRSTAIKVRYLKVAPQQAYINQPVVVTTNVINDGGDGSYNVMLRINGQVEQTQAVSVSGGTAKQVKFTVAKSQPGTYTVQVGNEKSMFTVIARDKVSESAPMNEGMIVVVIFGALLLVTVVVLLIAFRRPA